MSYLEQVRRRRQEILGVLSQAGRAMTTDEIREELGQDLWEERPVVDLQALTRQGLVLREGRGRYRAAPLAGAEPGRSAGFLEVSRG